MTYYRIWSNQIRDTLLYYSLDKAMARVAEILETMGELDEEQAREVSAGLHIVKEEGELNPLFDEDTQSLRRSRVMPTCMNCGSVIGESGMCVTLSNGKRICEQCIMEAMNDRHAREV
ncbi:MAG: hypothetical protein IJT54_04100 [Candidatus Methanomethylophilaceae archaeon]|nr:hypothetical protein [Candidatus Methanomethylophilaceae archaeon]